MIRQVLREQRDGSRGVIVPCFHRATSGFYVRLGRIPRRRIPSRSNKKYGIGIQKLLYSFLQVYHLKPCAFAKKMRIAQASKGRNGYVMFCC
jgi:hypothetical protein